jgi:minichromosome maintenance protein 10
MLLIRCVEKRKVAPKPNIPRVSAVGAIPALSFSKPKQTSSNPKEPNIHFVQPAPSKLVNKLAALSRASASSSGPTFDATTRSTAFAAPAPAASTFTTREPEYDPGTIRDDSLAVTENLELGPIEHKPPIDDPSFERLEPYSGIHLK